MKRLQPLFLVFACLCVAMAGCNDSPRVKVAKAETTYMLAADAAKVAVTGGLVKGQDKLDLIKAASDEANKALADANKRVQAEEKFDTAYWLARVNDAIARLAELTAKAKEN